MRYYRGAQGIILCCLVQIMEVKLFFGFPWWAGEISEKADMAMWNWGCCLVENRNVLLQLILQKLTLHVWPFNMLVPTIWNSYYTVVPTRVANESRNLPDTSRHWWIPNVTCSSKDMSCPPHDLHQCLFHSVLLLMEENLHHLGCIKPCQWWDTYHINWCRVSSINRRWWISLNFSTIFRWQHASLSASFCDRLWLYAEEHLWACEVLARWSSKASFHGNCHAGRVCWRNNCPFGVLLCIVYMVLRGVLPLVRGQILSGCILPLM